MGTTKTISQGFKYIKANAQNLIFLFHSMQFGYFILHLIDLHSKTCSSFIHSIYVRASNIVIPTRLNHLETGLERKSLTSQ